MRTYCLILLFASFCILLFSCNTQKSEWSLETAEVLLTSNKDGNAEIYLFRADVSQWLNLTNNPASDNWAEWSPDGKKIVFQSRRSGNLDIWVMNVDGSKVQQLTDHPSHDYLPAWTPDGSMISFTSRRQEEGEKKESPHIYIMNSNGTTQRRLLSESLNTSSGASWSPDGKQFIFSQKVSEQGSDLFMADMNGQIIKRLTSDSLYNGSAVYSPDGSQIVFYADNGQSSELIIMNADGSNRRRLKTEGQNWYPHWSGDGKWIIYTAADPEGEDQDLDIYYISATGEQGPKKLIDGDGQESEGKWFPF